MSTTKLARTYGFKLSTATEISAAVLLFCARIAASMTRRPMPVDRFAESITVIRSCAFSSSAASCITLPEEDILLEIEKQTILRFLARDKLLSTSMAFHCFVTFREGPHYTG